MTIQSLSVPSREVPKYLGKVESVGSSEGENPRTTVRLDSYTKFFIWEGALDLRLSKGDKVILYCDENFGWMAPINGIEKLASDGSVETFRCVQGYGHNYQV